MRQLIFFCKLIPKIDTNKSGMRNEWTQVEFWSVWWADLRETKNKGILRKWNENI